jgi:predicted membrane protein
MESIFHSLIATFLVIFLLFIIKTGLSKIGIFAAASLSFLFAEGILLSQAIFPLWQAILLMILLALCITYLVQKRFEHVLFLNKEINDKYSSKFQNYSSTHYESKGKDVSSILQPDQSEGNNDQKHELNEADYFERFFLEEQKDVREKEGVH